MATYQCYKADTNACVAWLSVQACATGYIFPKEYIVELPGDTTSTRLKGKARKLARAQDNEGSVYNIESAAHQSTVKLPTKIVFELAQHLVTCKKVPNVPFSIQNRLARAIKLRRSCSEWFSQNSTTKEEAESTTKHHFFTNCLVQIQGLLEPHFKKHSVPAAPNIPQPESINLDNLFESLYITDGEDDAGENTLKANTVAKKSRNKAGPSLLASNYEMDQPIDEDISFHVWCFFDDLDQTRKFLIDTWKKYAAGDLDDSTAATVTSIALEIICKAEASLVALAPDKLIVQGVDQYISISSHLYQDWSPTLRDHNGALVERAYFIESLVVRRITFVSSHGVLSRLPMKMHKAETFTMDSEQALQDEQLLSRMILDVHYKALSPDQEFFKEVPRLHHQLESANYPLPKRPFPYLDVITKLFYDLARAKVTVASVFASRIILDINQIMGECVDKSYLKLRQEGATANDVLDIAWEAVSSPQISADDLLVKWYTRDKVFQAIGSRILIRRAIETNTIASAKNYLMASPGHMWDVPCGCCDGTAVDRKPNSIWPSKSLTYYYDHNPIYCGMESLRLGIWVEKTGILLCDGGCEIAVVAHLYNMLKQNNAGAAQVAKWEILETVMEKFKSQLFRGSYPESPDEMIKRLLICFGIKASEFAPTARKSTLNKFQGNRKVAWPKIVEPSVISIALSQYLDSEIDGEKLLHEVNQRTKVQQPKSLRRLTQFELLAGLRDTLQDCIPQIRIDWITLHRQCVALLDQVPHHLETSLGIFSGLDDDGNKLSSIDMSIHAMRHATGGVPHQSFKARKKDKDAGDRRGKIMVELRNVFNTFIGEVQVQREKQVDAFSVEHVTSFVDEER